MEGKQVVRVALSVLRLGGQLAANLLVTLVAASVVGNVAVLAFVPHAHRVLLLIAGLEASPSPVCIRLAAFRVAECFAMAPAVCAACFLGAVATPRLSWWRLLIPLVLFAVSVWSSKCSLGAALAAAGSARDNQIYVAVRTLELVATVSAIPVAMAGAWLGIIWRQRHRCDHLASQAARSQ